MQNRYSTGIFKNESLLSPIRKSDQCGSTNGGLLNMSHELGSNSRPSRLSRYLLSEDTGYSNLYNITLNSATTSPQLRSRASGVKTTQTVAGPLLATTRHRIDPHLYTDVNSPGLTQRIVHYSEGLQNEKPTIEQRYKGIGQLPIINLNAKKSRVLHLSRTPVKIRVAPLDPVHIAEQRLHLLNSDQHRPIVPSPIQESAISPTKSVLDALKEISRKRIHNQDDSDYSFSEDISKRQRKESLTKTNISSPFVRPPISKRPRDEETNECLLSNRNLSNDSSFSKSWRPKKKQKNEALKCNDILSSLSSSRHLQRESHKRKCEMSPKDNAKQMKLSVHNVTNISITGDEANINSSEENTSQDIPISDESSRSVITSHSEIPRQQKDSPRVVLFNKKSSKDRDICKDNSDEELDSKDMPFVKPRTEMYKNKGLNYTDKCKLSQMLSCLSEKNMDDQFKTSNNKKQKDVEKIQDNPVSASSLLGINNSAITKKTDKTDNVTVSNPQISVSGSTINKLTPTTNSVTTESPKTPSPIINFGNTSITVTTSTTSVTTTKDNTPGGFRFPINTESKINLTDTSKVLLTPNALTFGMPNQSKSQIPTSTNQNVDKLGTSNKNIETRNESAIITSIQNKSNEANTSFAFNSSSSSATITSTSSTNKTSSLFTNLNSTNTKFVTSVVNTDSENLKINTTANNIPTTLSFQNSTLKSTELAKSTSSSTTSSLPTLNTTSTLPSFISNKSLNQNTAQPSENKITPASATGGFVFDSKTVSSKTLPAAMPQFNFGNTSKPISDFGKPMPAMTTSNSTNGFSFGKQDKSTGSNSISLNKTEASVSCTSVTTATSNFGTVNSNSIFGSNKTSLFGGIASTTTSSSFNAPITTSVFGDNKTTTSGFGDNKTTDSVFGGNKTTDSVFGGNKTTASVFGGNTASGFGSNTVAFGAKNAATSTTVSNTPSIFGNSGTASSIFGATTTAATTTSSTFNIPSTNATAFGSSNSFGVNTTKANNTAPVFGVSSPSSAPGGFSFGNKTAISSTKESATQPFSLNSITTATPFGTTTAMTTSFSASSPTLFGTTANAKLGSSTTSTFGSMSSMPAFGATPTTTLGVASTTNSTSIFGGSSTTSTLMGSSAKPSFGGPSATPSFGGSSATPSFGGSTTTPSFGGSTTTPSFGGSTTTPSFGGSTTTPSFGGSATTPSFGGSTTTPSFGGSTTTPFGGSAATFGGATTASAFVPPSSTSLFGAVPTTAGPSSGTFGSTITNTAFTTPSTNASIFGSNSQPTLQQTTTFNSTNASDNKSIFTFGNNNAAGSTPFQFGSEATAGKAFNFNAPTVAPAFGSSTSSISAPNFSNSVVNPGGGFSVPNAGFGANPPSNTFSIGSGGGSKTRLRGRRR